MRHPWQLLVCATRADDDRSRDFDRCSRERRRRRRRLRPAAAEVVVPAPPRHARLRAARLERAGDRRVPTRQTFDAHNVPHRRGLRLRRRDLADLLRRRQPPGRAELHQLVRARRAASGATRATCSRSAPTRASRSWTTGRSTLLPRETFERDAREPRARQPRAGAAARAPAGRRRTTSRSASRRAATAAATRCARSSLKHALDCASLA